MIDDSILSLKPKPVRPPKSSSPPISTDDLFETLRVLARTLEKHDIPHWVTGGSMLGAVRERDILRHDKDIDLDCMFEDVGRILALNTDLAPHGITLRPWRFLPPARFMIDKSVSFSQTKAIRHIYVAKNGQHYGDIYPLTIFSDGIARRIDLKDRVYVNAKMSLPAWFYEDHSLVEMRGEKFRTYPDPEVVCLKLYGPNWRVPFVRGDKAEGLYWSGSVLDSDIEMLTQHALSRGWDKDYSQRPAWPYRLTGLNDYWSAKWVWAHEPQLREDLPPMLKPESISLAAKETSPNRIAQYMRLFINKTFHYGAMKAENIAKAGEKELQRVLRQRKLSLRELKHQRRKRIHALQKKLAKTRRQRKQRVAELQTKVTALRAQVAQYQSELATIRNSPFRYAFGKLYRRLVD